ncbi:hypothetical protein Goari_022541 [Gossypium aridum]|uniref:Uncharacterized protein n=1 Tax=Gossypium aridum TaxID=34290 RepID=A0A7J8YSI9_GOSAI|nr:hypothetical protein [Gossypium aridum]
MRKKNKFYRFNTMANLWHPVYKVQIRDLGEKSWEEAKIH